jgi:hypothetical protein
VGPSPTVSEARANRPPSVSDQFPAYPRPANSQPLGEQSEPVPPEVEVPEATTNKGSSVSSPAWHPDPSGRFHYRWWNGSEWTSQVSTDGHHLVDTNPDQRIGPY